MKTKEWNSFRYLGKNFTPLYAVADIWREGRSKSGGVFGAAWDSSKQKWKGLFAHGGGYTWESFWKAAKAANPDGCECDVFEVDGMHVVPASVGLLIWED